MPDDRDPIWLPEAGDRVGPLEVTRVDRHGVAWRNHETGVQTRAGRDGWRDAARAALSTGSRRRDES